MNNKDFQNNKKLTENRDFTSDLSSKSKDDIPIQPLTQRKKIFLVFVLIFGIALSYPTVLLFGVICSAILLFQKNKKVKISALILIGYQIMWVLLLAPSLA